jgi:hypothetical protein
MSTDTNNTDMVFSMTSLKSYIPHMTPLLGLTPDVIYDRQRELMHCKLIEHTKGRGPGSGVRATPNTLATLLIGLMVVDKTAEVCSVLPEWLSARATSNGYCPITGEPDFLSALTKVLSDRALASKCDGIDLVRSDGFAYLYFIKRKIRKPTVFRCKKYEVMRSLHVEVRLQGDSLRAMAADIMAITHNEESR